MATGLGFGFEACHLSTGRDNEDSYIKMFREF
jgi:hypothetical protein